MTVLIPLRRKYRNQASGAKSIKRTKAGNNTKRRQAQRGSFTMVRPGDGTGKK